jgi:putative DNA primase/helicase
MNSRNQKRRWLSKEGDSLVDFCGYLMASVVCDGMFIGNAEIVPFSPRRYLYHAYWHTCGPMA